MQNELPRIFDKAQLGRLLFVSPQTIENMVEAMDLPPPMKTGNNMYWTELAIERWRESWLDELENWKY